MFICRGEEYTCNILDCLGFIEQCIACHEFDGFLMLGDFNVERGSRSNGFNLVKAFAVEMSLFCCEELGIGNNAYTYLQEATGRKSVVDHILLDTKGVIFISERVCVCQTA